MKMPKLSIVETSLDECVDNLDRFSGIRSAIFAVHSRIVAQSESRYNLPMARTAARLLEELRNLPPGEFDWLMGELLQAGDGSSEAAVEASWKAEVERRVADADAGNGVDLSVEEVVEPLRTRLTR
jgi:hypothetical protein